MHEQRILVAVLNWGLGHATRTQVLIHDWVSQGKEVWIASDGEAHEYLKQRFPSCTFAHSIPSSSVHYDTLHLSKIRWYRGAWQMHRLIQKDQQRCSQLLSEHHFDLIVSDSRLGFYAKHVKSVIISHQLTPIWPQGIGGLGQRYLHRCMRRFQEVWVPDREDHHFSGDLSRSLKSLPTRYLGTLSRYSAPCIARPVYFAAVILSGPEPARSIFCKLVAEQFGKGFERVVILGQFDPQRVGALPKNIEHLPSTTDNEFEIVIQASRYVLSRSGYSTIMDLHALGRVGLLIPTRGQTEQEYLAAYHAHRGHQILSEDALEQMPYETFIAALTTIDVTRRTV